MVLGMKRQVANQYDEKGCREIFPEVSIMKGVPLVSKSQPAVDNSVDFPQGDTAAVICIGGTRRLHTGLNLYVCTHVHNRVCVRAHVCTSPMVVAKVIKQKGAFREK